MHNNLLNLIFFQNAPLCLSMIMEKPKGDLTPGPFRERGFKGGNDTDI